MPTYHCMRLGNGMILGQLSETLSHTPQKYQIEFLIGNPYNKYWVVGREYHKQRI